MRDVRRRFLICLPAALVPTGALGFRLEPAGAEMASDYLATCPGGPAGPRSGADRGEPPPARLARCPYCGCAVIGARDHGERARPR